MSLSPSSQSGIERSREGYAFSASPLVYTGRWSDVKRLAGRVAPVRISVGRPRFIPGSQQFPHLPTLSPYGMLHVTDRVAFRRRYRDRLDKAGPVAIDRDLRRLHAAHNLPLMLCCYEDLRTPGTWCHRQMLAEWWLEHTGGTILDLQFVEVGDDSLLGVTPAPDPQGALFSDPQP